MSNDTEALAEISRQLRSGREVPPRKTRDFLAIFGAQRRGYWVVEDIRQKLKDAGLKTEPDFESAYIDSPVRFILAENVHDNAADASTNSDHAGEGEVRASATMPSVYADPTFRISKLKAANREPVYISPNAAIGQAVTKLLANDFSQLPVMTSTREIKGVISWTSIGTRLAVGKGGEHVQNFMDGHYEIRADASLFQAIPIIVQHQYVLVREKDQRITGIVTASDLSLQFQQLAEPFLLLGEIENHIRRMLSAKFSDEELSTFVEQTDGKRKIVTVADLSFGEYVRILENDNRWRRLDLPIDRIVFCAQLDDVRGIRNDVMHFDPDGIPDSDLERLRDFANFLQRLQTIGVT